MRKNLNQSRIALLSLSIMIVLSLPAYAAEEDIQLSEVMVTATRTEKDIKDTPSAVEIITRKDLDTMGAQTLYEALHMSTSIAIAPAMIGAGVSIRGMENRHILILVDGQRLTSEESSSTSNVYEWDRINMANVERIEIVRSDASSLYGSDALGGVINVITKKPGKKEITMSYSPARYSDDTGNGLDDMSIHYDMGKQGPYSLAVTAGRNHSDAIQEPGTSTSNYFGTRKYLNINGAYDLEKDKQLEVKLDFLDEDMQQKSSATSTALYDNSRNSYSLGLRGKHHNGDYLLRTYYSEQDKQADSYNSSTGIYTWGTNISTRKTWTLEGSNSNRISNKQLLTSGFEFRTETYEGTRVSAGKASNDYTGLYVQDEYKASDRMLIIPSLRYDGSDNFGSKMSPKLGMTYKMNDHYRLKASAGQGFKAPSLDDMYMYMASSYGYTVIGNPDLKPERSTNYEFGIEGEQGNSFGKLSYFSNDVKNLITTINTGGSTYTYENVDKADINGVELELGQKINDKFSVKMSYTYLDAIDGTSKERLSGRAKHQGTVQLRYDNSKEHGVSAVLWNSWAQDYWYDSGTSSSAPYNKSFNTWNVSVNKKWNDQLTTYAGVDNIFNKKDYDLNIWGSLIRVGMTLKL